MGAVVGERDTERDHLLLAPRKLANHESADESVTEWGALRHVQPLGVKQANIGTRHHECAKTVCTNAMSDVELRWITTRGGGVHIIF